MLAGRYWIACYGPPTGITRWLRFDLDCTEDAQIEDHLERYRALRALMGERRRPIVWQTPSGRGLRVSYAIPDTRIEALVRTPQTGLIAAVLRGAGLEPRPGRLEIYPQKAQADRLPLGRKMPLLDPETLQPIFGSLESYNAGVFDRSLRALEEALASPFTDLLEDLKSKPTLELRVVRDRKKGGAQLDSVFIRESDGRIAMGERLQRLIRAGLPDRSTRYESEFLIAMAMHLDPNRFARYGVRAPTDDVRIAEGVAEWLAHHHNGRSQEWSFAARDGSTRRAVAAFTQRYLARNRNTGEHMIDRAQRAAINIDPLSVEVRQLSRAERDFVLDLAETRYPAGAQRYRCEVWLAAFIRSVKENIRYRRKHGRDRFLQGDGGPEQVEVEILAEWLENSPYGSGRCSRTGRTRYVEYLQILIDQGHVELAREYSHHPNPRVSRARTYHVTTPDTVFLRDLLFGGRTYAPWILNRAVSGIAIDGNRGSVLLDDAYHDLYLATSSIHLSERYGRHTARKVEDRAIAIEQAVERLLTRSGVDLLRAA